jgi:hypothetical protein
MLLLNYPRPNLMLNTQSLKGCQMYYEANNCPSPGLNSEDVLRDPAVSSVSRHIPPCDAECDRITNVLSAVVPRGLSGVISRAPSSWRHPAAALPRGAHPA